MDQESSQFNKNILTYTNVLDNDIQLAVALKTLPTEGNLVYEYNPFRNYRLSEPHYRYKNRLFTPKELLIELGITQINITINLRPIRINIDDATNEVCLLFIQQTYGNQWPNDLIPSSETDPVLVEAGELTDFETNELNFDLSHPVNIATQYSYDNSVNLIINDGKNKPRLINSRFSATDRNKYQIVDRKGNNDTNIYDQGSQFDIDTSLYKRVLEIPRLRLIGISEGGQLSVGNYHFYFRYADADGNETDFVAESGLVSIFIGSTPTSIRSGFRDENSHKLVRMLLQNIDSSYQYVYVYYTKSTSDIYQNSTTQAYKVNQKFLVNNLLNCEITLTGYEDAEEIALTDINPFYQIADSVETQDVCQNMLFIGNIKKPNVPYQELQDLSLRFLPYITTEDYDLTIDQNYNQSTSSLGYYDPKYIYNKVGYWNHELYRLGIVYLLSDNTLSPVFNIRGSGNLNQNTVYSNIPMWKEFNRQKVRNYIITEEETYKIISEDVSYGQEYNSGDTKNSDESTSLENSKGVVYINSSVDESTTKQQIFSINFYIPYEVISYLKQTLNIKGFFFVRQKRIPTILCQAYTIGLDKESKTPLLPTSDTEFIAERFINDDQVLDNGFDNRIYKFTNKLKIRTEAAICPEYDIDSPYLNNLFSGNTFTVSDSDLQPKDSYLLQDNRNFYIGDYKGVPTENINNYQVKIIGVEDNTKLVSINDKLFSARAGEAEEAFRYEYLESENKVSSATNLIRGSFGPYLGMTGYNYTGKLIDIKVPGLDTMSQQDLFKIRYNDKSPFYSISERIDLKDIDEWFTNKEYSQDTSNTYKTLNNSLYRGDCYICQFTHRLNRNFQDPSAPANDKIVDENCWKDNYEISDGVLDTEKFQDVNLGDVNAIKLGMWVTLTVRSTKNLNIRAIDDSNVDEVALFGHSRSFFPQYPINAEGSYKIPEALCYNDGFEKSLSERWNYEVPDVPAIKNDFTNRIAYSDIHVNDAFKNGFRLFQGTHYRDYPKTYGSIIKIVELRGNLICVFEHGIALISVNERAVAAQGAGGQVYINTSNVLPENPKIISDTYGSQWRESIIKTPLGIYGVDTVGKKIWRTNGEQFECISDFKVQEFLNQNISLTERELYPIIGIRNVKTHYNKFKNDVMFTFYDNLYGFNEKVWNLCYNEVLQKWVTFYSWVPSYSENIYNQFFSFDRNTSKWISKLGISKYGNDFSDGVTLDNNIIQKFDETPTWESTLHLSNRVLPQGDNIEYDISYTLERDNYNNYKLFEIVNEGKKEGSKLSTYKIKLKSDVKYNDLCSEFYQRDENGAIVKDDRGRRVWLDNPINSEKIVILLNINAHITITQNGETSLEEAYSSGFVNKTFIDAGYYQSVVAITPQYNLQFLTTDFWKHGQAGIIDIADNIYPTYWYGKQHPFEFEFVMADSPQLHKIFDNLEIISNNAEPESFHYEIIGDSYEFAKDKKNMYIRQEATKELYQYNGSDITYDNSYSQLQSTHRPLLNSEGEQIPNYYDKSTILPLYYSRQDKINEIEDYYNLKSGINTKDFSALSGGEIVRYPTLDEYRLWNHAKAIDLNSKGRLRGNMQYKEDRWFIQINPINFVQKNEPDWSSSTEDLFNRQNLSSTKVPIELKQSPIPNEVLDKGSINYNPDDSTLNDIPSNSMDRAIVVWNWEDSQINEAKLRDKWIKIRIRYSGKKLAIITAIKTLYSATYA